MRPATGSPTCPRRSRRQPVPLGRPVPQQERGVAEAVSVELAAKSATACARRRLQAGRGGASLGEQALSVVVELEGLGGLAAVEVSARFGDVPDGDGTEL